jgi:hypothetical protein
MKNPLNSGGLAFAAAIVLTACGGGGDDTPPPARGTLLQAEQVGATDSQATIDAGAGAKGIFALTGPAACNVEVRHITYATRDPVGNPATATAGVFVPAGAAAACTGQRPVLLYAHGTTPDKAFNMALVAANAEASLVMAFYAAQGFIVVAPNYMGYDTSSLPYTPYLNAESVAVDMVDALRAAKAHLAVAGASKPSNRLLISGYSQGGHAALAMHKIIERDYASEFTVTASGPMSGPYNLVKMGDAIAGGQINLGATLFLTLQITSYQKAYGNIYGSPSEVYQSPYDQSAETLLPSTRPVSQLIAEGKLPNDGGTFTRLFGAGGLLTDGFRASFPNSNMRKALQTNTLLGWNPRAPVALCGGDQDPTVFFFNTVDAQADFATRGTAVPAYNLEVRNSLPAGATGDAVFTGFQQAKAATASAGGSNAVAGAYHGSLVPPFCSALVRGQFQAVLAASP